MAAWVGAGVLAFGIVVGAVTVHVATAQAVAVRSCGSAASQLRTTLYFGGARPKGSVSELEWQLFLRDEVTQKELPLQFADGSFRARTAEVECCPKLRRS